MEVAQLIAAQWSASHKCLGHIFQHAYLPIRFDAFGERSGTVLFWMEGAGLVQLNLGTKKAIVLWKGSGVINYQTSKALVHEVDLVSMLQCMKTF
jgi:hypothetical protein